MPGATMVSVWWDRSKPRSNRNQQLSDPSNTKALEAFAASNRGKKAPAKKKAN